MTDLITDLMTNKPDSPQSPTPRPRLAILSPIPPAKSGVADYTADLLPALAVYYDITVIDITWPQGSEGQDDHGGEGDVHDIAWLMQHGHEFDRILYQMGNSEFHIGMLEALAKFSGVVVLHDFFLGYLLWREQALQQSSLAYDTFHQEHGLGALALAANDLKTAIHRFPANQQVFCNARAVLVHSAYAQGLAAKWHGPVAREKTHIVNFPKPLAKDTSRTEARNRLNIARDDFVVCSFGYLAPSKLSERIVNAWCASDLSQTSHAHLIFVGQSHSDEYDKHIRDVINTLPNASQISITEFVSPSVYRDYLMAADLGIHLRQDSRGETSGAVMDAMSYGLPQIANANGSFAELDPKAVTLLPDEFEDISLAQALNSLYLNPAQRQHMSEAAKHRVLQQHSPERCAARYRDLIEMAYQGANVRQPVTRRLFLDVTATDHARLKSGIERVALALCRELMDLEPTLGVVTPVCLAFEKEQWVYREAIDLMGEQLGIAENLRVAQPIEMHANDTLLILDLKTHHIFEASQHGMFERLRARGVRQYNIVHDLLPLRLPDVFPPGTNEHHARWLQVISTLDGALCISAHVADDLRSWRDENGYEDSDYRIGRFMLGADLGTFDAGNGHTQPEKQPPLRALINRSRRTFLMVGTIEPRKGYLEVLDSFERLWRQGHDFRLVVVGRPGWPSVPHEQRRDIPHTVFRFTNHPEKYRRFIWIANADDRKLEQAYEQADCLIAASYDEGFGLPLVEAARRGIPVIARDIAVFREVAPEGTRFFKHGELDHTVANWQKPAGPPQPAPTITWKESAQQVLRWLDAG